MIRTMQELMPYRIVYRRNEANGGCFRSINTAANMATTEILASLDSDTFAGFPPDRPQSGEARSRVPLVNGAIATRRDGGAPLDRA